MALVFPAGPAVGTIYPSNPGTSGVAQWEWDGAKWVAITPMVSLGVANQGVFNSYMWPAADGTANQQLTTDGAGNLSWALSATPSLQILGLLETIDGVLTSFTLVQSGTTTPFSPSPSTNIVVFLGGVPQLPTASYTVVGNTITFTEAPLAGTTFYAVSNIVL